MDNEHRAMVSRLVKDPAAIWINMNPGNVDLWHGCTGVVTEAGELMDACKKAVVYGQELDVENVVEELGDLEFYLEQIRQRLGIKRSETLLHNVNKLSRRYPSQNYSDKNAEERADKKQ